MVMKNRHPLYEENDESPYGGARQGRYGRDAYGSGAGGADPYEGTYDRAGGARRTSRQPEGDGASPYGGSPYDAANLSRARGQKRQRAGRGGDREALTQAKGVRPVTTDDYTKGSLGYNYAGKASGGTTRRGFIAAGVCAGVAAVIGIGGALWWNGRAVACEIDGTERTMKVGATVQDMIDQGYASPKYGDMLSIADKDGNVEVVKQGGGDSYTVSVNGEQVDASTYRLQANDKVEFTDGADVTEPSTKSTTAIPCGIQYPPDGTYLVSLGYVKQWGKDGESTVETGTVSGRVVDRGVTTQAQDLIIGMSGVNPSDGRLLAALTFDDGPSEYTPQVLDILASYGAKATFFEIGQNVANYPEYSARVVSEGHQLSSHTYSHVDLTQQTAQGLADEIDKAADAIEQATGERPSVLRPPGGNLYGKQFLDLVGSITYSAYWSVDTEDWQRPGSSTIVSNACGKLNGSNYNGAIILMHDGGGDRSETVAALPSIIEAFQGAGYQLVTLNDLIASDSTIPSWVSSGDPTPPEGAVVPDAATATITITA